MANTSLSLGKHWETFIQRRLATGRYGSASELVRESLRLLEERETPLEALRAALVEGEESELIGAPDFDAVKQQGRHRVGLS